ncbi:nitronate monooxygenase [Virgibacillus halodenitrificans]|uniref:NAD(P)H-dependent flavin oxidoreductase n=1 Tax=Virgibacillus halodenitrificans TaxID=1482 RepID=UPI0024C0D0F7|nr:nitronate monooxygenase [Virgibacillus halodenitrificans]WHX25900.1 nitronate monooxygenase [Virgibacillus halodenitrificans]
MSELDFCKEMNIAHPIIQAGMAGGITTPELVAAVATNGCLGTIGAGYMSAPKLKEEIKQVKMLTSKPFAVNVFAINLETYSNEVSEMQQFLNKYRQELSINEGSREIKVRDHLHEKIQVILDENIPIVSTAFGVLTASLIERLKANQVKLIGMATNVYEAKLLEEAGYDAVVAQGYEAGGHRSTFDLNRFHDNADLGLIALVERFKANLQLPIIAAGAIHTREQIKGLLAMGVSAVQLGTKFLIAREAGTNAAYRHALLQAEAEDTLITRAFSGRPARAVKNRFIDDLEQSKLNSLPFPLQNEMTKDIRATAKEFSLADLQSLWAGQGVGEIKKEESVKQIINSLI